MSVASESSANADAPAWPKPPVRLRTLVLLAFVVGATLWLYPRAVAAWQVHALATTLADYGACMVGPTGPSLLRSSAVNEFERLARRRLLGAAPNEAPFARCAPLAGKLAESEEVERAHQATAGEFREYGAKPAATLRLDLAALRVSPEPVKERARLAWPFVRDGYTRLVQTSLSAKEAIHPVAPPKPAVGRGLPGTRSPYRSTIARADGVVLAYGKGSRAGAYKSNDGGVTWRAWPTSVIDAMSNRCAIDDHGRGFAFGSSLDGTSTTVESVVPGRDGLVTPLAPASHAVLAAACDSAGLVVLTKPPRERPQELWTCEFEKRCTRIDGPALPGLAALSYPADIARVGGTTVLALAMGDVVRVASSRDNGKSWTPLTVAYDGSEYPDLAANVRVPTRLLTVGRRLLLHGAASKASQSYSILFSDDHGASFRAN